MSRLPQSDYNRIVQEIMAVEYFYNRKGKIQIMEKDDIKEKLDGKSPDAVDALALAFMAPTGDEEWDVGEPEMR